MAETQSGGARAHPFGEMFDFRTPLAESFAAPGPFVTLWKRTMVDVPLTVAAEAMRFAGRRLEAQADYCAELAKCGTLSEAMDAQSAFMEEAAGDVSSATAKMISEAQAVVTREAS